MQHEFINCPKCGTQIELSETLAHPFVEAVRSELGAKLRAAQGEAERAKADLVREQADIVVARAAIESEITKGIASKQSELRTIIRGELEAELKTESDSQEERIARLISELKLAKVAQLHLVREREDLELRSASVDLEIAKGINERLAEVKLQADKDAGDEYRLKIAELNKKLEDTTDRLEEAKRKAQQGSQQLQGEVLELDLESGLSRAYPRDLVDEVKKGQRGADCKQRVITSTGAVAGTILWEAKRAQVWSDSWIEKLRDDARNAKAEVSVLVSEKLPVGVEAFSLVEGVWVVKPKYAVALASALREVILQASCARGVAEGKQSKAGLVYDYVTGPQFLARVQGIAEPFRQMQDDLSQERRLAEVRFNKRQKQIERVLTNCFGMAGDLQGLAGHDVAELEAVELRALEAPEGRNEGDSNRN